jgi:hypothetical protein
MPNAPTVHFDRFYQYEELTAILRGYAAAFPALAGVESIGQSHEGRDIWCLTITNGATGAHDTNRPSTSTPTCTPGRSPARRRRSIRSTNC